MFRASSKRAAMPRLGKLLREDLSSPCRLPLCTGASIKGLPEHVAGVAVPGRISRYANVPRSTSGARCLWHKLCRTTTHMTQNGDSQELKENKISHSIFSRGFHDFEGCPSHCDSL
uniref:Uncharacterized protein n=1 Tax=Ralstonia solanacearum TaxID=305 RepID=A0A0S4TVS4_RALSL|nr:protein of unknown function [Ralstonia solanacearum]